MPINAIASPAPAPVALEIDHALIERFGGRGPRYTSYPTADRFDAGFVPADYLQALLERAARRTPLGLYVHVPFCRTICYYCGCNKIGTRHTEQAVPYLQALKHEIDLVVQAIGSRQQVSHLHFGGGTPTFLLDAEFAQLFSAIRRDFMLADDGEYSIEVDPRSVSPARLRSLRALGLNRISLGIQDIDPAVQAAVNRIQPWEQTRLIMDEARAAGFRSINADLIYGLPRQSLTGFARTLDQTIEAAPDRVALYQYAHLPEVFKPQRRIEPAELPGPVLRAELFELAVARFARAGYTHLGLDHFARPDDELALAQRQGRLHRNFQGYCSHDEGDLIALGVSAISSVGSVYAQNDKALAGRLAALAGNQLPIVRGIELDPDDHIRRDIIQDLMCNFAVDRTGLSARFGAAGEAVFDATRPALAELEAAGVVRVDAKRLTVEPAGRLLVRAVAMAFDRHLSSEQMAGGERYPRIA